MRKIVFFCSILLLVPIVTPIAGAQETSAKQPATAAPVQPVHYYHLDFIVEDLDVSGKVVNSRSCSTIVDTEHPPQTSMIRTGSKIPIIIGSSANEAGKPNSIDEYQYENIGVDLDIFNVHEVGRQLAFDLTANLSGEASSTRSAGQDPNHPVIRENRWQSKVLIPIGKRTVVFTSDSLDSKGSTRVVVNATPIED